MLNQAQSISTSYPAITKQAELGKLAHTGVDKWLKEGFNSAKTRIMNNTNEEIEITNVGITAKTYDDITETYDDEQLRITHNILAFTDDNWETIKTALGKFTFTYYKPHTSDTTEYREEAYGLVAEAVLAGWVVGSTLEGNTIIGGHIQNPGNSVYIDMYNDIWTDREHIYKDFIHYDDGKHVFRIDKAGNITTKGGHISEVNDNCYIDLEPYQEHPSETSMYYPYFLNIRNTFMVTKKDGTIISKKGHFQNMDNTTYIDLSDDPYFLLCNKPNVFSVNRDGYLTATSGAIGGFYITDEYISSDMDREAETVIVGENTYASISLSNSTFWRAIYTAGEDSTETEIVKRKQNISGMQFAIGSVFGVTSEGGVYCSNLYSQSLITYELKAHTVRTGEANIDGLKYNSAGVSNMTTSVGFQFKSDATGLAYHVIKPSSIERHNADTTVDTVAYLSDIPQITYSESMPTNNQLENGKIWLVYEP